MSLLPARMKKIPSRMRALEYLQAYRSVFFFRRSRAASSAVSGGIPPKFNLIQAYMVVLVTYKNEEDPIKNEGTRVLTRFFPLYVYGKFSNAQGQLTPQPMVDSCQNSNSRVLTRLYVVVFFSDAQGQLTP